MRKAVVRPDTPTAVVAAGLPQPAAVLAASRLKQKFDTERYMVRQITLVATAMARRPEGFVDARPKGRRTSRRPFASPPSPQSFCPGATRRRPRA